jgi:hypothetical protein
MVEFMARELDQKSEWQAEQLRSFDRTAQNYLVINPPPG